MVQKYSVLFIGAFLIVFSSCVSKKKYLEMESGRLEAEEQSRQLTDENNSKATRIEALIADFESMKNELLESNAIKDNYIDSLNSEVFVLTGKLSQNQESLESSNFNLDFEKQRLTSAINSKDRTINSLKTKIESLETQVSNVNTVVDQKNFEIGNLTNQSKLLEEKIQKGETNVTKLQSDLHKIKTETDNLRVEMKKKDAEITKLQNNVNLLKKEIGS